MLAAGVAGTACLLIRLSTCCCSVVIGCLRLQDATVTMAYGRRYGLVGRNGTGKTTLLRAMAHHQIKGIPENCQILHVEQEVGLAVSTYSQLDRCM